MLKRKKPSPQVLMARKKRPKKPKVRIRKVSCYFTDTSTEPNYKEVLILRRFITDRGRILPKKITGLSADNQRKLSREIKKARFIALLPYTDRHAI
jgi:small subunit ribosomal protein S18